MNRNDFKVYYCHIYGTYNGWKSQWKDYRMNNTVADTTVCQSNQGCSKQPKQEVDKTMFDECMPCTAPRTMKVRTAIAPMANAQVIANVPVEATQRDYAIERIKAIGEKHAKALRVQFNMDRPEPKTFLELEALIKAGDYQIHDKAKEDEAQYYGPFYGVTFGKPADKEGYEAARLILKDAAQKALDGVTLKTLDALEGVIDGFEAWTLPNA